MTSPNHTVKSDRFNITYSTAQGSCLGPLLFIIFVNDIHFLPLYSKIILFADDTMIFNSHKLAKYLQYTMEHDRKLMVDWFCANKLSLNLNKTVVMEFWGSNDKFDLKVNDYTILQVCNTRFLGVYIDNQLTWFTLLNYLIEKLNTNRCMLSLGKIYWIGKASDVCTMHKYTLI